MFDEFREYVDDHLFSPSEGDKRKLVASARQE